MRLVHIRAASDEDVTCLMRELAVYSPKHLRRAVVIELEENSHADLLALLTAVETCLFANDIAVSIAIDGKKYMMRPPTAR